jgi:hypothetical protein
VPDQIQVVGPFDGYLFFSALAGAAAETATEAVREQTNGGQMKRHLPQKATPHGGLAGTAEP